MFEGNYCNSTEKYSLKIIKSTILLILITIYMGVYSLKVSAMLPKDYVVMVTATTQQTPPLISLTWVASSSSVTYYKVYRKEKNAIEWGTPIAQLSGTALGYNDTNVLVGATYEYRIENNNGNGYIYSGITVPAIENRGKIVLVVDNTYATQLVNELKRLEQDLIGDGWVVLRHDVSRNDSPESVKNLIKYDYDQDSTNVNTVFLFGHIPVLKSGNFAPDGHEARAWPADVYYGDMDGIWTDNNSDGIMDQIALPSDVELQVGRVDLFDMPAFAPKTELDLLRQYLDKDHKYRQGLTPMSKKAFIHDDFHEFYGEAFSRNGWGNFPQLLDGVSSITEGVWKENLLKQDFLWSHACGAGGYSTISQTALTTNDFAKNNYRTMFLTLFGSWFGEWSSTDNLLRAPLGMAEYGLTSAWTGRPHWYFHHMGLGETFGYSTKLSQNNSNLYYGGSSAREVHIALMGDPTLRMYPVSPPVNLTGGLNPEGSVELKWGSITSDILGYYVYKSVSSTGPFERITQNLVVGNDFVDNSPGTGTDTYMVRAVKLEKSKSGTFQNISQGTMVSITPDELQLKAVVQPVTGLVTISGSVADNEGKPLSIKVVSPSGLTDYFNQITSDVGGRCDLSYKLRYYENGNYNVYVNNSTDAGLRQTSFNLLLSNNLDVGAISFLDSQKSPVNKLIVNTELIANATISNATGVDSNATLVIALYDSQNVLKKLSFTTRMISADNMLNILQSRLVLPENLNGYYLKSFIWDDLSNIKSLCNSTLFQGQ